MAQMILTPESAQMLRESIEKRRRVILLQLKLPLLPKVRKRLQEELRAYEGIRKELEK